MQKPFTVLALPGSLRRASWNRMLLQAAAAHPASGMSVTVYDRVDAIPLFNEELEGLDAHGPVSVRDLRERVREADGLLISTPEYNQSLSGVLKNMLDWLSRPAPGEVLKNKPVAIMGASAGRLGTARAQYHLRQVFVFLNMFAVNQPEVMIGNAADHFDAGGNLINDETKKLIAQLLANLVAWTRGLQQAQEAAKV
jgi:chromate reductase